MADGIILGFLLQILLLVILIKFTWYSMKQTLLPASLPQRSRNNEHSGHWPPAMFFLICSLSQNTQVLPHYLPCISSSHEFLTKWRGGERGTNRTDDGFSSHKKIALTFTIHSNSVWKTDIIVSSCPLCFEETFVFLLPDVILTSMKPCGLHECLALI